MPISKQYRELILKKLPKLTSGQKRVAEFFLANLGVVALSSIDDIARDVNVSKATIVRTARALGYKGFLDMRTEMLRNLRENLGPVERFQINMDESLKEDEVLITIAHQEVANINTTLNVLDKDSLYKAVEICIKANHIYSMGLGISAFLSQITTYLLNRVTLKASSFSHGSMSFVEQIIPLRENDVIIAFSFPPYSSGTIEAAQYARGKGIKVVSVTDKMTAPIVEYSDVTLQVKTESKIFANSLSAILVVVYGLATEIAFKDRQCSHRALARLEETRTKYGGFLADNRNFNSDKKF